MFYSTILFGELELSLLTVIVLICLSMFTFLAVGLSSFKLVQSAIKKND